MGRLRKPKRRVHGTLSEAEVTLLIHAARTLREKAMITALAYAGLRNRELGRLRISDVNLSGRCLSVREAKPQKDRHAHIAAPCVALLSEYMRDRRSAGQSPPSLLRSSKPYAPQNTPRLIRTTAKRASLVKRIYPHLLRHSLANNLLHRGVTFWLSGDQLGHAFVETTMIYVHSDPELAQQHYQMYAPS